MNKSHNEVVENELYKLNKRYTKQISEINELNELIKLLEEDLLKIQEELKEREESLKGKSSIIASMKESSIESRS